jgi:protein required for attachment to host cells
MNNQKTTWILVAHRSGAVLFQSRGPGAPLTRIARVPNPRGRLKAGEIEADRPGRAFDRHGGGRHAHATEESPVDHIESAFVSRITERLEHGRTEGAFERLVLIAPAKMLGKIREAMPDPLRARVIGSVAKDLAHCDGEQVRSHLVEVALV